jgi:hypothetical protein
MIQDFQDSRKAQIVNALAAAAEKQVPPLEPKSEAELEAGRRAAAVALNAVYLRELKSRYGEVAPRVTASDVLAEALKAAQDRE